MGRRRSPPRAFAFGLVALLVVQLALVAPSTGASTTTEIMTATLPSARDGTAAVTLGGYVYVFGGDTGGRSDQIVRYDPLADQSVIMGARLPVPRAGMSAVAADGVAYLFGGWDTGGYSAQIVRYDPTTDRATIMGTTLPSARTYTSAVWDGSHAYIFGGGIACSPCTTEQIVRYDPTTDTITTMSAQLPTRRYGTSAVWDGSYAYVFGGVTASTSTEHADIVRYDPATDTTEVLPTPLPAPRYHSAAAFLDGRAFIIGGYPCTDWPHYCDSIVSFEPSSGTVTTEPTRLNTARYLASATARGDHIYIAGGYDGTRSNQILRYGPGDAPPATNQAPILDPVGDLSVITGGTATRHVRAVDPDGDRVTLGITGLPAGASFTDRGDGTGTLTWHTTTGDDGTYTLTARADDGRLLDTQSFTIYVDTNPPPVVAPISDRTVIEGARITLSISARDPANDPITLTATGLPATATFTDHGDGTATFDWSTTSGDHGVYEVTIHASDGSGSDSETFHITVIRFDRAPVFDPAAPDPAVVGEAYQLLVHATDPDGDPIALSARQLPPGAAFTDLGAGDGRLDWTPLPQHLGTHGVKIVATAGSATAQLSTTIDVLPPYAFTLKSETFGFLKAKPGDVMQMTGRLTNTGYHADTYTFTGKDAVFAGQGWTITAPAPITLQPGEAAAVTLAVTVPAAGTYSKPRLTATSTGDAALSRILTSVVEVPILLDIALDDPTPTVSDLGFLGITGTVTATWWDGTPISGQTVSVQNHPGATNRLGSEHTHTTDATGTIRLDYSLDPMAALPGDHVINAQATRGGRTDTDTLRYTVTVN